jgi:hypothetical protein
VIERGTVTRVVGRQVYVEVPRLGLGVQFGPCDVAWIPAATGSAHTGGSGTTMHSHGAQTTVDQASVTHSHTGSSGSVDADASGSDPAHAHPVTVDSASPSHSHGATTTVGAASAGGGDGGSTAHTHPLPTPKVGDRVLVSPVHGIPDDVVVLGIIG